MFVINIFRVFLTSYEWLLSSLHGSVPADLYPELHRGHSLHLSSDGAGYAQIRQTPPNQATCERHVLGSMFEELSAVGDTGKEAESIVLEHVHALVVRPEVVDLFPVNKGPKVCADEFHRVQFVLETWPVPGQAFDYPVASGVADVFQIGQVIFLEMTNGQI